MKCEEIESMGQSSVEIGWPLIHLNDEIHIQIYAFQLPSDKTEVNTTINLNEKVLKWTGNPTSLSCGMFTDSCATKIIFLHAEHAPVTCRIFPN